MTRLQKDVLGYGLLFSYLIFPVVLWQRSVSLDVWTNPVTIYRSIGQICGLLGASLFSLNFILAARLSFIENLMSGLPRIYSAHHSFGGLALILLLVHPLFLSLQYVPSSLELAANFFVPSLSDIPKLFGQLALLTLIGLLFITFFIRIAYHKWKSTHQWLGFALMLASLHVYLIPGHLSLASGLRPYMLLIILVGLTAFCYRVLFGRWLVRRYPYRVKTVKVNNNFGTEVELTPINKPIIYRAGQFFFIRVHNALGITREPHPFSFTSAPNGPNISFAAKPLGDYTNTLKLLKSGARVDIEGPYGRFIFNTVNHEQVWLAGGIGITPFMSRLRELKNNDLNITLYYSVKDKSEALFLDELIRASRFKNFKFVLWESNTAGRFSINNIKKFSPAASFFLCGPVAMIQMLKSDLRKSGVKRANIYAEEFKLY